MANLSTRLTGLPFIVWISQRGNARDNIRVKVALGPKVNPDELVSVAILPTVQVVAGELASRELEALKAWIDLNRDVLIAYSDGDLLTDEALGRIQR